MPGNLIYAGSRHRIRRWRNYGITSSPPVAPVEFLFRDDFLTDEVAPLTSPRTAEPGPGIATTVDGESKISIVGEEAVFDAQGTPNFFDEIYISNALTRIPGLAMMSTIRAANYAGQVLMPMFFNTNPPLNTAAHFEAGFYFASDRERVWNLGANVELFGTVNNTEYEVAVVLESTGAKYVTRGGVFADWTFMWRSDTGNSATLYAGYAGFDQTTNSKYIRVSQLPSPWDTDFGIATDRLAGARGFGDQFTHEADFIGEFIQTTVPTAGFTSFQFRRQDVNNYWSVVVEPSTDLSLFETVAGVPTLRGIAVGVVGNGDRIVVIADGTAIRVYEQNTLRITYALAANFQTETDGSLLALGVGGAISDIVTWPRVLSGAALRALNRVVDA